VAISPRMSFYDVTKHFAKADPSVIMGVGSIVDAPTAGIYIANGAKFVVSPLTSVEDRQTVQPSRHPLQPRLRLGDGNR
jgi:2-dehydro-3-deoxyphosphogluconate aldolase/(4S)-4-hydroxy-2-oxoglutarate aldolase